MELRLDVIADIAVLASVAAAVQLYRFWYDLEILVQCGTLKRFIVIQNLRYISLHLRCVSRVKFDFNQIFGTPQATS